MNAVLSSIMLFIQSHTGLTPLPPGFVPSVEQLSVCDMTHLVQGPKASCEFKHGEAHVAALYIRALNRVLVPDDFNPRDPRQLSFIVHEMTHAMQAADARAEHQSCMDSEMQAYAVQGAFLAELGLDPKEEIGFDSPRQGAEASCQFTGSK